MSSGSLSGLECAVIDAVPYPLEHVPDAETERYDARITADLAADVSVLGTLRVPAGTPIEIKTCRVWIDATGSNGVRRRGRWWIARAPHEELLKVAGVYLLVTIDGSEEVVDHALVGSDALDAVLTDRWTSNGSGGGPRRESAQLPWGAVLDGPEGSP